MQLVDVGKAVEIVSGLDVRINMLTSLNNSEISMKIHIQFLCVLPKIMQLVDVGKAVEIVSGLDVRINILTSLNNSEISLKIHMPYVTYACSLHVNANLSIFQLTFSQNFSQGPTHAPNICRWVKRHPLPSRLLG